MYTTIRQFQENEAINETMGYLRGSVKCVEEQELSFKKLEAIAKIRVGSYEVATWLHKKEKKKNEVENMISAAEELCRLENCTWPR